jgi:hypothetical protein
MLLSTAHHGLPINSLKRFDKTAVFQYALQELIRCSTPQEEGEYSSVEPVG